MDTWPEFVLRRAGYTFLWQDLDGLRMTHSLPERAPATSLLHGWSADGRVLVRVRLDHDRVWEASLTPGGAEQAVVSVPRPWGSATGRVARFTTPDEVDLATVIAQVGVIDTGVGALTLLVPEQLVGNWS